MKSRVLSRALLRGALMLALLGGASALAACGDDDTEPGSGGGSGDGSGNGSGNGDGDGGDGDAGIPTLHVLASIGEGDSQATYLAPADSLDSGSLSFLGNGTELGGIFAAAASGGYIYAEDFSSGELVQIQPTADGGYEITASLVLSALTPQGFFRTSTVVDENTLLLVTWPDPQGNVDFAIIDIPELAVRSKGSFVMEPVGKYNPVEVGSPVVVGDKVYLGAMYWVEETQEFATEMHAMVMDYPSFTNPVRFSSDASVGGTGGFGTVSAFQDESGDIYQHNIRSKFWYNMGTAEDKPTVISRIAAGATEYDTSYEFNISEQFDETVSLIAMVYVGDGIAYGAMLWEDRSTDWGEAYSQNRGFIARFDLNNQTATAMNLPDSPVLTTTGPLLHDGSFYMPLAPRGQQARVYNIDPTGGADAFTPGLELDGNNVSITGLYYTGP